MNSILVPGSALLLLVPAFGTLLVAPSPLVIATDYLFCFLLDAGACLVGHCRHLACQRRGPLKRCLTCQPLGGSFICDVIRNRACSRRDFMGLLTRHVGRLLFDRVAGGTHHAVL